MVAGMLSCLQVQEPTPTQHPHHGQAGVGEGLRGGERGLGRAGGAHVTLLPYLEKLKSLNMVASENCLRFLLSPCCPHFSSTSVARVY